MRFLRYNTAVIITVGPFVDFQDGVTPETALTVTACHLQMIKDDDDGTAPNLIIDAAPTASGGDNDMVHITNDDDGMYSLELTATQTSNYGRVIISITDPDAHAPVWHEFMIVSQNFYDAMMGSDNLQVDTVQIEGTDATDQLDAHDGNPLDAAGVRSAVGLASANLDTQLDALPTASEINAEVVDVLKTDTSTLPPQETPPTTPTFEEMVTYIYKFLVHKSAQDGTTLKVFNSAGTVVDHKATVTDDGTTFTRGKIESGP